MENEPKIRWNDLSDEQKNSYMATEPNEARFWTGVGTEDEKGEDVARDLAKQDNGKTLEMKLDDAKIDRDSLNEEAPTPDRDGNPRNGWSEASEKFAEGSSGDVKCYEGDTPRKDSTFNNTEAPALDDNDEVDSVTKENASGVEKENGKYTRNDDGKLENSEGEKLSPAQKQPEKAAETESEPVKNADSVKTEPAKTAEPSAETGPNIDGGDYDMYSGIY